MINAKQARDSMPVREQLNVSSYVEGRINDAVAAGYDSVSIWIKNEGQAEAEKILKDNGFEWEIVKVEAKSKQLRVTW